MAGWIILVLIVTVAAYGWIKFQSKRGQLPPGPMPLPFLGNISELNPKTFMSNSKKLSAKYGGLFTLYVGTKPWIFINDYAKIKTYFTGTAGENLTARPFNFSFDAFYGVPNAGLTNVSGDKWREQRRFSLHTLRDFGFGRSMMEDGMRKEADEMLAYIRDLQEKSHSGAVDLHAPLTSSATNTISLFIFGRTFHRYDQKLLDAQDLVELNLRTLSAPETALLGVFPALRNLPLFGHFGYDNLTKVSQEFWKFLNDEFDTVKQKYDPEDEPNSFAEAYIKEVHRRRKNGENVENYRDEQAIRVMGDFWTGGFETTVTTLRWAFLHLAINPDVQNQVHLELDEYYVDGNKEVEFADKQHLPYTMASLQECQRMANILPINIAHANHQDMLIDGYHIPKGTSIIPQVSAVMDDPNLFPEPEKMKPERFLDAEGKLMNVPYFLPFSLGKRVCAGESLARMELFMLFVIVLRNYRISPDPEDSKPRLDKTPGFVAAPYPHKLLLSKK